MKHNLLVFLQNIFLKVGERIALIILILVAFGVVYAETASQAHSQEAPISFEKQISNWYENNIGLQVKEAEYTVTYTYITAEVTPTPTPTPITSSSNTSEANQDIWEQLAQCESKGNWSINTGNGYYGGLQFNLSAWNGVGGQGYPHEASKDEQIMRGKMLQEKRGWSPWGACSKKLGLL